ncbi:MAG: transcriptional regulator [Nitrososphaerota archaeon]|jgi:predicted transcriptional regulator of viral defense system|nr:transcriptional regulator [Nitrososphaerota archaeon]
MKYYAELAKMKCFTKTDLEKITDNTNTAGSILKTYQKKGYIKQIKRNLYATVSLETDEIIPTRYKIANTITNDTYLSHHTAFEYYGCTNQVFNTTYVSGKTRFTPFEFDNINYQYIYPRLTAGTMENTDGVRTTDIERTILDSINDFEKIAGLEELLQCLELIPYTNENKLLHYLKLYNKQILYQKTGYILSYFKDTLRLSDQFFEKCKQTIGKSIRYLYMEITTENKVRFDKYWQLFVPQNLIIKEKN